MFRVTLRFKLIFRVLITTSLIFGAFLIFNNAQLKSLSTNQAIELANNYAQRYAAVCKNQLDLDMGFTKALAQSAQNFHEKTTDQRDNDFKNHYLGLIKQNPKYISVWNTLELRYIDSAYTFDYGRKSIVAYRANDAYETTELIKDTTGHNEGSAYFRMKKDELPAIMEPYLDLTVGDMYITSLTYPIWKDGEYAGQAGIDIPLTLMQELVDGLKLVEGTTAMVVSNSGIVLGHTMEENVGDTISSVLSGIKTDIDLSSIVSKGETWNKSHKKNNAPYHTSIVPFVIDGTNTPWAFCITMPINPFMQTAVAKSRSIIWLGILGICFIVFIIGLAATKIVKPVGNMTSVLEQLSQGNINSDLKIKINTRDEIKDMGESVNKLLDGLQKTESFSQEIEKGNLSADYSLLGENDSLGSALLGMQKGLLEAKEKDELRRVEDQCRNWALDGLTSIANLIRREACDSKEFMQILISKLVRHTNSMQGGIYLVNESGNKKTIELVGSYALEGSKTNNRVLEYGEGLIGVTVLEAKTNYLKDIPKGYTKISSGLGSKHPKSLIIVPLIYNAKVLGVLEMASFGSYEDYEIKFIEDVAESIANTIETIKMQQAADRLLQQSQVQTEQMMEQEEELRQNMEEMMATQEEMERKEHDLKKVINELQASKTN